MGANADTVRRFFRSYLDQDLETATSMMADAFVFSSPQDDFIGKAAYLQRCFPTVARLRQQTLTDVVEISDTDVFVRYVYDLVGGGRHRNTEVITVREGRISEVQVYFGAELTVAAPGEG